MECQVGKRSNTVGDWRTLSQLNYHDLGAHPAWAVAGDPEAEDVELAPVRLDSAGRVPRDVGEVWCLCEAVFADGSRHLASAMCRGDSDQGPLLWTVWNGAEDVPLLLPPAPDFVLEKEGPEVFVMKFRLNLPEVFPMRIEVVPRFAVEPEHRSVALDVSGPI
jgi:hypothetical protein